MYTWSGIRTFCLILLCIPLVHLAYLFSRDTLATLDASPTAWAQEVDDYTRSDQGIQLPENPVVVVGGRRVKLWHGLEDLLAPEPVLMRGLGDATIEDILYHYERLVAFYRPAAVVFLPSDSEFHIRDSKSAGDYIQTIQQLAKLDSELGPDWPLILLSPIKTPLRPGDHHKIDDITGQLQRWGASREKVVILDSNALLAGSDGRPNPAFFRPDGVHLNEGGYLILSLQLKNALSGPGSPSSR